MIYQGLPSKPGVYLFKGTKGQVLYIGKAINLKKRVKNYFQGKTPDLRLKLLVGQVKKIDYQEVASEIEALLLEARLIKEYRPKYNVRLKDDKRYLYVGITKDEYPRIWPIRQPEKTPDLLDWFGPFPSAGSLREILRLIRRIFPYHSCKDLKSHRFYYHLGLCPGFETQSAAEYRQTIQKIRLFLSGQIFSLIKDLTKQMTAAAKDLRFEEAQLAKRQIEMIQNLLGRYKKLPEEEKTSRQLAQLREILVRYQALDPVIIHRLEAYDVANLGGKIVVGSMAVFLEGEPETSLYRQFKIPASGIDDPGNLKNILQRRLAHQEWLYPQVILVDGGKGQVSAAFEALKEKKLEGEIGLLGLAKKRETIIIPRISQKQIVGWKSLRYSSSSPVLQLLQQARDEAHRFAQRYYHRVYKKGFIPSDTKEKLKDQNGN